MFRVVLSHALCEEGMQLLRQQPDVETIVANTGKPEELLPFLKDADAFLLRIGRIDAAMMDECPKLKVIARPGVGVDTIDVPHATAKGIPVVVTPGANSRSVAEHSLMLMFALAKNLYRSVTGTLEGNYGVRNAGLSFELEGKTLGVLGFGNIGRRVAKMAAALDIQIAVYDPFVPREAIESEGFRWCADLKEILPICDMITLHMFSDENTRGMFDAKAFAMMKPGALLVNCARGDLVDEDALYDALMSGQLGGAAEDMMVEEPFDLNNKLFQAPNFLATPHMAALTKESAARCAVMAIEGILAILRHQRWPHVFDKQVYENERWQ